MDNLKLAVAFVDIYLIASICSCFPFHHSLVEKQGYVDEPVRSYVKMFKRDLDVKQRISTNIYIQTVRFENNWAGKCYYLHNTIIIDREDWEEFGPRQKMWIVYHELGHCWFRLGHEQPQKVLRHERDKRYIMYPTIPPEHFITPYNWSRMLNNFRSKTYAR